MQAPHPSPNTASPRCSASTSGVKPAPSCSISPGNIRSSARLPSVASTWPAYCGASALPPDGSVPLFDSYGAQWDLPPSYYQYQVSGVC